MEDRRWRGERESVSQDSIVSCEVFVHKNTSVGFEMVNERVSELTDELKQPILFGKLKHFSLETGEFGVNESRVLHCFSFTGKPRMLPMHAKQLRKGSP